jgi:Tol biopolymer transport system component
MYTALRSFALPLLLLAFVAHGAHAQGFNTLSGRNHPELDWRQAETKHFEIMYPERLAGIDAKVAAIAETTYDSLAANLNTSFEDDIRIYLTDADEVGNGFAAPIGNGYTGIWVNANDVATNWTGRVKWLRKVLAHELAHIFHYQAVYTSWGLLDNFFGDPTPRFWTEGLAQYETERWDAFRGDQWLRTATLDDALSYEDGRSLRSGQLLYAVGNSQLRFFAEQYGDSTLTKLLAHRSDALFGLHESHDFDDAFRATTGESHGAFREEWRRHLNVYYNLLAARTETVDSLAADTARATPLSLPGQYYFDVAYSPDTARVATLALTSLARPVRRLYVTSRKTDDSEILAEGAIEGPVAWSDDGEQIAFSRRGRGPNGGLIYDLFVADAPDGEPERLTHGRRAHAPTFAPGGDRLAFVGLDGGTANLFLLDLASGEETKLTDYTGNVQLASARWHPSRDTIAFARFRANGVRDVALLDVSTGEMTALTPGRHDDRRPVWHPDGERLAYTSFRDDVPNTFVYDLDAKTHRRVTNVVTGATATSWLPPDSSARAKADSLGETAAGRLVVTATPSQTRDQAYFVEAERTPHSNDSVHVPAAYSDWAKARPPRTIPRRIASDSSLVTGRSDYNSWANITHVLSLPLPYYDGPNEWGVAGLTVWNEPLGKHALALAGSVSFPSPLDNSYFLASYVNNQFWPTLTLSGYSFPYTARIYDGSFLVEDRTGVDLSMQWPLDALSAPYAGASLLGRLRYAAVDPLETDDLLYGAFDLTGSPRLPEPERGEVTQLTLGFQWKRQRPYRFNNVHPLDGLGLRAAVTGAADVLGAESRYLRGDLASYAVVPALGKSRLFVYGRAQAQTGDPLMQNYIGFSRYDAIRPGLPGATPLALGAGAERVRGYRSYALGTRVLFGSVEYRALLLPSLGTQVLGGLVSLGATAGALFADGGLVWSDDFARRTERLGVGAELKNALRLFGFPLTHAVGLATPPGELDEVEEFDDLNLYYRVRTPLPF